ncbi:hypothetical protein ACHAWF_001211 [Thalassiosira exigua]
MVPLWTKVLAFMDPGARASWQSNGFNVYYVGRDSLHYRLLRFHNPTTRASSNTETYTLYPAHCTIPTISKADLALLAAQELLQARHQATQKSQEKFQHTDAIKKLTQIIGSSTATAKSSSPRRRPARRVVEETKS